MRRVAALIVASALIVSAGLVLSYRQEIQDTIQALSYTPSPEIVAIEQKIGLTGDGERIFRATSPAVVGADSFNDSCPRQEVASPIVGCYTPDDAIFVYDIKNEKLSGIKEVTAAHELLHAVWRRMSPQDQATVGVQLESLYEKTADDTLKERMEYYRRAEPGQERNELFAILGTEMPHLGDALEQRYARYFDRTAVVSLYEGYRQYYDTLNDRVISLQAEAEALAATIESQSATYNKDAAQLDEEIRSFNSRAQSGVFTSQTAFTRERSELLRRLNTLESTRVAINDSIRSYETLYAEYTKVNDEIKALNDSLDSFKSIDRPSSANEI